MAKKQLVEFFVGLAVIFMGLFPFLGRIEQLKVVTDLIGGAGGTIYQIILIVLGLILLFQSFRKI